MVRWSHGESGHRNWLARWSLPEEALAMCVGFKKDIMDIAVERANSRDMSKAFESFETLNRSKTYQYKNKDHPELSLAMHYLNAIKLIGLQAIATYNQAMLLECISQITDYSNHGYFCAIEPSNKCRQLAKGISKLFLDEQAKHAVVPAIVAPAIVAPQEKPREVDG
jgi:hypothetical protein